MLNEIFIGKTVKTQKLYVITPKVYLISPWIIMNAMQIFVFLFKIAPTHLPVDLIKVFFKNSAYIQCILYTIYSV